MRGRIADAFRSGRKVVAPRFDRVFPKSATASSAARGHPASAAIDKLSTTYWAEGARGSGIGQSIVIVFDGPQNLDRVGLTIGAQDKPENFLTEPRPREIQLRFSDGTSRTITLKDTEKFQAFEVAGRSVSRVTIRILSVYASQGEAACALAEVEFFTKS